MSVRSAGGSSRTRACISWNEFETRSAFEAPTIRVLDAFTSGDSRPPATAAIATSTGLGFATSAAIHSMRTGIVLDGQWSHSDSTSNTWVPTPSRVSRLRRQASSQLHPSIGDPNIDSSTCRAVLHPGTHRVRRNLHSSGVRYEMQTLCRTMTTSAAVWRHVVSRHRRPDIVPVQQRNLLRWLGLGTYEQTLRVDGFRQQELNIAEPPSRFRAGRRCSPVNRYMLSEAVRMPRQLRFSSGIDRRSRASRGSDSPGRTCGHLDAARAESERAG